jgi:hypothetical protein
MGCLIFCVDGSGERFGGREVKLTERFNLERLRMQPCADATVDQISAKNGDWSKSELWTD